MNKISVFIPTYHRVKDLERCLKALKRQTRLPDEVVLTIRNTDNETHEFLNSYNCSPLKIVETEVFKPGVLEAHNQGYQAISGNIVAITDDDAAPRTDWLEKIEKFYLRNPEVGGYGGRDLLYENGQLPDRQLQAQVGIVTWFGKVIGNHHVGHGNAREVDVLKGVNSSYRYQVISGFQYDVCLKGQGTNSHWELALGLYAKSKGWKLIYDPALLVDHYQGERRGMAERLKVTEPTHYNSQALTDSICNQTYILLCHLPTIQRYCFLFWSILVGTKGRRGLVQCLRFLSSEKQYSVRKFMDSTRGRWIGWNCWQLKVSGKR